jgi:hypothetical protein
MSRYVLALVLFCAAALVATGLTAEEPRKVGTKARAKKLSKVEIAQMMKDAHYGPKTPDARIVAELKKDSPDWEQIAKDAKAFTAMGQALEVNGPFGHPSLRDKGLFAPKDYIASASALSKAASEKDKKAATAAFTGLTKSCAACHCYDLPPELRGRF